MAAGKMFGRICAGELCELRRLCKGMPAAPLFEFQHCPGVSCWLFCSFGCAPQISLDADGAVTDPEATARFAVASGVTRFDPHPAISSYDNTRLLPVYDRLIHMNPAGEAIPAFASANRRGPGGGAHATQPNLFRI